MILKLQKLCFCLSPYSFASTSDAQYKTYKLSVHGDTLNAIDNK